MDVSAMRTLFRTITGIQLTSAMSDAKITEALDRAHTTIGLAAEWSFHQLNDQAETSTSGNEVLAVAGVYRFDTVQHDGGPFLHQITPAQYDMWPTSRKASAKPYAWSNRVGAEIRLHPTPDAAYDLLINGWSEPGTLSLDGDTPDWTDADLHPAVPFEAAAATLELEGDDADRIAWVRGQADQWFELMFRRYNPELASITPARRAAIATGEGVPPIRNTVNAGGAEQ